MNTPLVNIRKAVPGDAEAIADVHVATWRTTYTGIVAQAYLDALSVDERTAVWQRRLANVTASRSEIFVADVRGRVVGFVAGGPRQSPTNGYDAQLHAIYLRSEAQGRGAGRALARVWAAAAISRGLAAAVVDVLAGNPARGFYEHLGAHHLEDIEVVIGGGSHIEARYGWTDLHALVA